MQKVIKKQFRCDEVTAGRLAELSAKLGEPESEVFRELVNAGFDVLCDLSMPEEGQKAEDLAEGSIWRLVHWEADRLGIQRG